MASVETHWFVVTCLRTFFDLSQKLSKGTFAQQWDPDRTTASDWKFPNLIKVLRFSWNFKISITCFNYHTCFNQVQRATKKKRICCQVRFSHFVTAGRNEFPKSLDLCPQISHMSRWNHRLLVQFLCSTSELLSTTKERRSLWSDISDGKTWKKMRGKRLDDTSNDHVLKVLVVWEGRVERRLVPGHGHVHFRKLASQRNTAEKCTWSLAVPSSPGQKNGA